MDAPINTEKDGQVHPEAWREYECISLMPSHIQLCHALTHHQHNATCEDSGTAKASRLCDEHHHDFM